MGVDLREALAFKPRGKGRERDLKEGERIRPSDREDEIEEGGR